MIKGRGFIVVFMSIIGFGLIIAIPIGVLSVSLSSYDRINVSTSFEYLPDEPSAVESLNLEIDYGDIVINYIDPSVEYMVKIDVNIEMAGAGLTGKEYTDYFNITEGDSSSSPINFTMRLLPGITAPEVESLIKDVSVIVTIQKGIVFDIFASVINGDVSIEIPFKVRINSLYFNLTNGNIFYFLNRCIVGGNISGTVDNGKIVMNSENAEYIQNSVWTLCSNKNSIDITQHNSMGANVTGSITTVVDVGTRLIYNDTISSVGAKFTLYDYAYYHFPNGTIVNFDYYREPVGINRYTFKSTDFPASNNYILGFYLEGILNYDLYST